VLNVHGLTIAATAWSTSAIGCIAAAGLNMETIVATIVILTINLLLIPIENNLSKQSKN